jgi:hypothetical protein
MSKHPAFPFECVTEREFGHPKKWTNYSGLTKREYFAAMAMQALIAASGDDRGVVLFDETMTARSAVKVADALLAALEGK